MSQSSFGLRRVGAALISTVFVIVAWSCGGGGVVSGAADTHCGTKKVTVDSAACAGDGGVAAMADYGDTLFNAEGDDDDCKYHVKWSSNGAAKNADVKFNLTITNLVDGSPTTSAAPDIEAFLSTTHPAPNSGQKTTEAAGGAYTIGPVHFDASGRWTVRFHVREDCTDTEDSPHGHAAFYVDVP